MDIFYYILGITITIIYYFLDKKFENLKNKYQQIEITLKFLTKDYNKHKKYNNLNLDDFFERIKQLETEIKKINPRFNSYNYVSFCHRCEETEEDDDS